jgi:hypothetical protein
LTNLFSPASNNLFADAGDVQPISLPGPQVINQTARIAAIANLDTDTSDPDILKKYDALTQQYADLISKQGDLSLRYQAAGKQQQQELESITKLAADYRGTDPTLAQGAIQASHAVMDETVERRQKYALEQQAVEKIQNIAASGDKTQALIMMHNITDGQADDVIRDMNVKKLLLSREIENAGIADHDKGWFSHLTDFAMSMIPFKMSMGQTGNIDLPGVVKHWYDNIFAGQRRESEAHNLWMLNPADFADELKRMIPALKDNTTFMGYHNRSEELDILSGLMKSPNVVANNAMNLVDNFGLLPVSKIAKIGSLPALLVRNGARREAAEAVASAWEKAVGEGAAAAEKATGITEDQIVGNTLPSIVNPIGADSTVPLSGDAVSAMERGKALLKSTGLTDMLRQPGRMTDVEQQAAIKSFTDRVIAETGNDLKDVSVPYDMNLADGSQHKMLDFTFGRKTGGGYKSEGAARRAATDLGYVDHTIVRDESGQYFWKVTKDVPEAGFYTNLEPQAKGFFSRNALSSRSVGDKLLQDMLQMSGNTRNKIVKTLDREYGPAFKALSPQEHTVLDQVLAKGEQEGKWLTRSEFDELYQRGFNRSPTTKEHAAYQAARDINDIEFVLRNRCNVQGEGSQGIPNC